MEWFIKNWKDIGLGIGLIFLLLYFFGAKTEFVEIPIKVEVPVPVVEVQFDTIYKPKPYPVYIKGEIVKKIDSAYYKKFIKLTDSIEKIKLFEEAISIHTYKETVEDDTLSINLNMTVRGELLEYQLGYKTKPRNITLDTTIKVPIPTQNKFYGGFSLGMPITPNPIIIEPIFKGDLYWKTKSDMLFNVSLDSRSNVWGGIAWKF